MIAAFGDALLLSQLSFVWSVVRALEFLLEELLDIGRPAELLRFERLGQLLLVLQHHHHLLRVKVLLCLDTVGNYCRVVVVLELLMIHDRVPQWDFIFGFQDTVNAFLHAVDSGVGVLVLLGEVLRDLLVQVLADLVVGVTLSQESFNDLIRIARHVLLLLN